ncbi:MAG: ATP synthase F1 subunit gamma [Lentimicrobiaceae bacterium]|nr:ATP synthase F1 subunit gamma [Lentimicrobiaceae bacterium]
MANLKEIRIRIASVKSTQKITSAMKMVSAAKLRRAQSAIQRLRPYSKKLNEILGNIANESNENNPLAEVREKNNTIFILISSNKGLCGGFNNAIIKQSELLLRTDYATPHQDGHLKFITIGKRVSDYVRSKKYDSLGAYDHLTERCSFDEVAKLAEELMSKFLHKETDKVVIVYNEFKNAATQVLSTEQYLPIVPAETMQDSTAAVDYIFEPSKQEIYENLIPKIMKLRLYKCILDSIASEHGARMTAMHKATENADELIKQLNLTYNKVRQSAITNEIIEIVGGAEALVG